MVIQTRGAWISRAAYAGEHMVSASYRYGPSVLPALTQLLIFTPRSWMKSVSNFLKKLNLGHCTMDERVSHWINRGLWSELKVKLMRLYSVSATAIRLEYTLMITKMHYLVPPPILPIVTDNNSYKNERWSEKLQGLKVFFSDRQLSFWKKKRIEVPLYHVHL